MKRSGQLRLKDSLVQLARSPDISTTVKGLWQTVGYRDKITDSMRKVFGGTLENFIEKATKKYGNTYDYSKVEYQNNRLADVKYRDAIKDRWCYKNNIQLLRISYLDTKNINKILLEWCK